MRLVSTSSRSALAFAWTCCPRRLLHPHSFPFQFIFPLFLGRPFQSRSLNLIYMSARLKRSERGRPRSPITPRKGKACYNRSIGWCLALTSEVGLYTWSSLLSAYVGENKDQYKNEKEYQQVSVTTKTELKDSILVLCRSPFYFTLRLQP